PEPSRGPALRVGAANAALHSAGPPVPAELQARIIKALRDRYGDQTIDSKQLVILATEPGDSAHGVIERENKGQLGLNESPCGARRVFVFHTLYDTDNYESVTCSNGTSHAQKNVLQR